MRTQKINGVVYELVHENENDSCQGCCFNFTRGCAVLTDCCTHKDKYGNLFIYKELAPVVKAVTKVPKTVWIVKNKETGEYVTYCRTRRIAREYIKDNRYWNGFSFKPKVVVKGSVTEVGA